MAKETINQDLVKAAGRIQLVKKVGDEYFFCYNKSVVNQSCIWDPVVSNVPCMDMKLVRTIVTTHSYGHPLLFKPSKYEVLKCIPCEMLDVVTGFEILSGVETDYNNSNHIAKVNLYTTSNSYINYNIEL